MSRHVTLVCGPPCAGKTTYVTERARPGDVVLDQDVIGARAMREGLARVAAMATGTAWVIRCSPGPHKREALARQICATDVVLLVPPTHDLVRRAAHRPNPRRHIQAVRRWLDTEAAAPSPATRAPAPRAPRSRHRAGRPHRRAVAQMFQLYGHTCHLCGHGGARQADHLIPLSVWPDQPIDPHLMRPAHGGGDPERGLDNPCPTCQRRCNQQRGTQPVDALFTPTFDW